MRAGLGSAATSQGAFRLEFRFNAEEWQGLSNEERVRRCRLMAEEAITLAKGAPPELKEGYLSLSRDWLKLATEMDRAGK